MYSFFIDDKKLTVSFEKRISKKNADLSKTYCKVVFNKSSTNFIPLWANTKDERSMKDFAEWVAMVIEHEFNEDPEHYSLRGMSDRLSRLGTFLREMLNRKLPKVILHPLGDVLTHNQYKYIEDSPKSSRDSDLYDFAERFFYVGTENGLNLMEVLPKRNVVFFRSVFLFESFENHKMFEDDLYWRDPAGFHFTLADWIYGRTLKDEFIAYVNKLSGWDDEEYANKKFFDTDKFKEISEHLNLMLQMKGGDKSMVFNAIDNFILDNIFD